MAKPFGSNKPGAFSAPNNTVPPKPAPAPMHNGGGSNGFEVKPSQDAIRKRAYEIYLARAAKGQPGNATSDWVQAERDLGAKR